MDGSRVWDFLGQLKQQEQQRAVTAQPQRALDLPRARALILDPGLWTREERELVTRCPRSRKLLEQVAQAVPRVPWWELAAYALGRLTGPRARTVKYLSIDHAGARQRVQTFATLGERLVSLMRPTDATTPTLDLKSSDQSLHVNLFEDHGGRTVLEVRTQDATLAGQLVGCVFRSGSGVLPRYLVLGQQPHNGWFTGHVVLEAATIQYELGGRIETLEALPLEAGLLDSNDGPSLAVSLDAVRSERQQCAAWRSWLERATNDCDPLLRPRLDELRRGLGE
jgi:hypothetical protein